MLMIVFASEGGRRIWWMRRRRARLLRVEWGGWIGIESRSLRMRKVFFDRLGGGLVRRLRGVELVRLAVELLVLWRIGLKGETGLVWIVLFLKSWWRRSVLCGVSRGEGAC